MLICFSHVQLFATLWTVAHQVPLSMRFSRQEFWSGLPCLPPGDLPDPGTEQVGSLPLWVLYHCATWALVCIYIHIHTYVYIYALVYIYTHTHITEPLCRTAVINTINQLYFNKNIK